MDEKERIPEGGLATEARSAAATDKAGSVTQPTLPGVENVTPVAPPPLPHSVKRRRRRWRKQVSRYSGYYALRLVHAVASRLPLRAGRAAGWALGTVLYYVLGRERRIALSNLQHAFGGERTAKEIRRLGRNVFRNSSMVAFEWIILRRWPTRKLRRKYPHVYQSVMNFKRDIEAAEKGVIGITAHFGNWEVLSLLIGRFAPDLLVAVAKRSYFEKYNEFFDWLRRGGGTDLIYNDESARKLIRALSDGKLLGFLPDQDLRTNSGIFVNFFNRPAYTVTLPVELARKVGSRICVVLLRRDGDTFQFSYEMFDFPRGGDPRAAVGEATARWSRLLEERIREFPDQWCWMHPRWRSTPDRPRLARPSRRERQRERAATTGRSARGAESVSA